VTSKPGGGFHGSAALSWGYMAGITVPTAFFLIASGAYTLFRLVYHPPVPVERFIVFPLAAVPNAWGLWNVVFILWRQRLQMSIGLHGALLPFLIAPLDIVFISLPNVTIPSFAVHFSQWRRLSGFSFTTRPGNIWWASSTA
jgi:hypothetical protein